VLFGLPAQTDTNFLLDLSLAELIQVPVETPSKTMQSLNNAAGIVSVYTDAEIELFGGRDLGEVLSRVLGFKEYNTLLIGRNTVTMRSDSVNFNNNHVLFLLNGTPVNRESYSGGIWNQSILLSMPLSSIKQLEVTRGPGSVLYGTNAFAGVVNVITRDAQQLSNTISVGYGSNNSKQIDAVLSGQAGDWQWTSMAHFYDSDGWHHKLMTNTNHDFSSDAASKSPSILTTASNGAFSGTVFLAQTEQSTLRGNPAAPITGETENNKYFVDLEYKIDLAKDWQLKSNLSHVNSRTDHSIAAATPGELGILHYESDDSRFELTASGNTSSKGYLIMGGAVDYLTGEADTLDDRWHQYLLGFYAQYEHQYHATKYIIGAQYNESQNGYHEAVPRLGLIHHFSDQYGFKALYGQAFRAPYMLERDIELSIPALSLQGDKGLDPEIVTTWDLQFFYTSDALSTTATLFHSKQTNLIVRDPVAPNTFVFTNKGELTIKGVELEGKYAVGNHWFFTGNYSYQQNKDGAAVNDFTLQPDHAMKIGVSYRSQNWSLGVFDSYYSSSQDNIKLNPNRIKSNPSTSPYHLLSANLQLDIPGYSGWGLKIYGDNLLAEDIYLPTYPGDAYFGINSLMVASGRFFMLTVSNDF